MESFSSDFVFVVHEKSPIQKATNKKEM